MIEDFNEAFDIALALHAVYVPSPPPVHGNFVLWILNGVLQKGHANSDPDECIPDIAMYGAIYSI